MTTEMMLTPVQVDSLLEGVLRASGSRLGNYTYQKTLDDLRSSIRAIEQAVLQSPEIQALRKDAERYRWLREDENRYDAERWMCDKSPSSLDSSIDAAMEVKP